MIKVRDGLTTPNRTGTVANIAPTKKTDMTMGPLFGSALKMWRISGSLPYLNGFSYFGFGAFASTFTSRLKM